GAREELDQILDARDGWLLAFFNIQRHIAPRCMRRRRGQESLRPTSVAGLIKRKLPLSIQEMTPGPAPSMRKGPKRLEKEHERWTCSSSWTPSIGSPPTRTPPTP